MADFKYITDNEIALSSYEETMKLVDILMNNGYVCMISREEQLYIVNYIWSTEDYADRNAVCFQSREEVEDFIFNRDEEE